MKRYSRLLIITCISYILINLFIHALVSWDNFDQIELDNKITLHIEKNRNDIKTIYNNKFEAINTGERVRAIIPIPKEMHFQYPALCFTTYSCITKIWYDGNLLYSHGEDLAEQGKMIGTLYDSIILPREAIGDSVVLECIATEKGAMSQISNLLLMEAAESSKYPNTGNLIGMLIFTCIFVFSFFLFFILLFLDNKDYIIRLVQRLTLMILSVSVYIISSQGFFHPLVYDFRGLAYIEYISFFFLPIPFALFFYEIYENKILKRVIKLTLGVSTVFFIICTILNYTTVNYHYVFFLPYIHLEMFVGLLVYLSGFFIEAKHKEKEQWVNLVRRGFIVFLILMSIELIQFYIAQKSDAFMFRLTLLPMGIILVIVLFSTGIIMKLVKRVQEIEEKRQLEKLAFTDVLTGLASRTKCYTLIEKIKQENIWEYTIFFIDLNDLKYYNDKYGHNMGDDYIKTMALIMTECFEDSDIISRFGGDEFVVFYLRDIEEKVSSYLETFYEKIKSINDSNIYPFTINAACGVVSSTKENPLEIEVAIASADQKMYENKKLMKEKRT